MLSFIIINHSRSETDGKYYADALSDLGLHLVGHSKEVSNAPTFRIPMARGGEQIYTSPPCFLTHD